MKEKILQSLKSDSFEEYLKGVELLGENIGEASLPDSVLDQELIERACAVLILERWAEHEDYLAQLKEFTNELPAYADYLGDDEIGHYMRGLALFIDGLLDGETNLSGFLYVSGSAFIMAGTAAEQIKEYFEAQKKEEAAALFGQWYEYFDKINSAQFGMVRGLMDIEKWSEDMALGFYNIMTSSDAGTQGWMLGALYKVIDDPVVKTEIFGKYLTVLKEVKKKFKDQENERGQVEELIKMVREKSRGN